ncbi:MAG: HD domain-containing protein [Chloroflexi bacterium]|nr:MAG: HD domain-containing protein [Chloroflexota bacterium]
MSALIVKRHLPDGLEMARKHRLPRAVQNAIPEHHGTMVMAFFYVKAQEQDPTVRREDFCYPGPRPRSRETAILMLADGCESSVRSRRPQSRDDIRETVDYIFETRLQGGQLDDSGLTLNDLRLLRDAFLTALQGVFHPRIAYPGAPGPGVSQLPVGSSMSLKAGTPPASVPVHEQGSGVSAQPSADSGTDQPRPPHRGNARGRGRRPHPPGVDKPGERERPRDHT